MNPKAQPELHPDADSLNAFAEHALPEAERAGIMTHLAGCARCREVVYLAQAAAGAEAVAPGAMTKGAQPGWISGAFGRWRVALIPAAALATVGGIVLWVHLHPAPAQVDMAHMGAPPPASHAAPAAAAPTPTASPERAIAPPRPAPMAKRSRREATSVGGVARGEAGRDQAAPAMTARQAAKRGYGAVHLDARSASLAVQAPPAMAFSPSAETAFQPQANQPWHSEAAKPPDMVNGALTARLPAPAPVPGPAPANVGSVHGAAMVPAAGGAQPLDSATASRMVVTPETTNSFALLRLARRAKLPSGLNAVSSAAMLNRLLAVDAAGSVFLSQDGGKHWEAVAATWRGKALEVEAPAESLYRLSTATLSEPAESATLSASAPVAAESEEKVKPRSPSAAPNSEPTPPAPAMLFRLVTDRHKTWVSPDGKIWREQ